MMNILLEVIFSQGWGEHTRTAGAHLLSLTFTLSALGGSK